jgi:flavin reductase (DIM6/NTAB) family NADH-FMN oxidoreductase RutF
MPLAIDSQEFRRILGHYPTGVCAITAMAEDGPVGMIVGSFTSVSLNPPLVAFLPDRKSASWPKIEASGRFCVNVLSEHQQHVCRVLSSKAGNRFEALSYRLSAGGLPILDGIVAWIDCRLFAVHEAGDHYIAIGQVHALNVEPSQAPLIFFQGSYGSFVPAAN